MSREMLGLAYIRGLEVATFYFMFQLQPVGSVAHIQVCGTTSCMICGAEDLMAVCKERIAQRAHELSADGKFSWEEVECLGACSNAPMAQIGKDYYEDLTTERLARDHRRTGRGPRAHAGSCRTGAMPPSPWRVSAASRITRTDRAQYNASAQLAERYRRYGQAHRRDRSAAADALAGQRCADQDETREKAAARDHMMPPSGPDGSQGGRGGPRTQHRATWATARTSTPRPRARRPKEEAVGQPDRDDTAPEPKEADVQAETGTLQGDGKDSAAAPQDRDAGTTRKHPRRKARPSRMRMHPRTTATSPSPWLNRREGGADDLRRIKGVGPKLEKLLNEMGFFHYDQIAGWSPDEVAGSITTSRASRAGSAATTGSRRPAGSRKVTVQDRPTRRRRTELTINRID